VPLKNYWPWLGSDDRCFATAGPMLRKSLSEQLRQPDITFGQFKRSIKTFVFGCQGRGALWLDVKCADWKSYLLTYLLSRSLQGPP